MNINKYLLDSLSLFLQKDEKVHWTDTACTCNMCDTKKIHSYGCFLFSFLIPSASVRSVVVVCSYFDLVRRCQYPTAPGQHHVYKH